MQEKDQIHTNRRPRRPTLSVNSDFAEGEGQEKRRRVTWRKRQQKNIGTGMRGSGARHREEAGRATRGTGRYEANRSSTGRKRKPKWTNSAMSMKRHTISTPTCCKCNTTLAVTNVNLRLVTCIGHTVLHTGLLDIQPTLCTLIDLSYKPHLHKTKTHSFLDTEHGSGP